MFLCCFSGKQDAENKRTDDTGTQRWMTEPISTMTGQFLLLL